MRDGRRPTLNLADRFLPTIRSRLSFILLAVILPFCVILVHNAVQSFREQRDHEFEVNLEMARAEAQSFDAFIMSIIDQELAIGINLTMDRSFSVEEMNKVLATNKNAHSAIRTNSWVSPEGRILASNVGPSIGLDISDRPFIKEVIEGKGWAVSNLIASRVTGDPIFPVCRGIRDRDGKLLGISFAVVIPGMLDDIMQIDRSRQRSLIVLDREGIIVYRQPHQDLTWENRTLLQSNPFVRESIGGKEVTGVYPSPFTGIERISAIVPCRLTGYLIVVNRSLEEVIQPIRSRLVAQVCALLLLSIAAYFIAVHFSRSIAVPVALLSQWATSMGRGELKYPIEIAGPAEVRNLCLSFNDMAERLVEERTAELKTINALLEEDINERKKAERALRESEERYRLVFQHVPQGIIHFDKESIITDCNERFAQIIGAPKGKIIGFNLLSQLRDEKFRDAVLETMEGKTGHFEGDYVSVCGNKPSRLMALFQRINSENVPFVGAVGIFEDITERKLAELEREKLIVELRDALSRVKLLGGLLPICANCKKIRDDKGYWQQIEAYIRDHSDAVFSHGICPDCLKKLYPEFCEEE